MKIYPRQQVLDIWQAVAKVSFPDQEWVFGGCQGRNSISDAEQLLCLMAPATRIRTFGLDMPDETTDDVLAALKPLGDCKELPRRLIRTIAAYFQEYSDEDGTPLFSGGSYFIPTDQQQDMPEDFGSLDVVDSYAMSIRLCLATIGFIRIVQKEVSRPETQKLISDVEEMASTRLTAAMIGLIRSFAVYVFDIDSPEGRCFNRTVNQGKLSQRQFVDQVRESMRGVIAGLRDTNIEVPELSILDDSNWLFECGWSWGVVKDRERVETAAKINQRDGLALGAPYLYFTVVALDGVRDLFTQRTRVMGLLNEEQHRLARTLQAQCDHTQSYWEKIATFHARRWPLEDFPWQTNDGMESDYFTMLVASIVVEALSARTDRPDVELERVGNVLHNLAGRARITWRPCPGDPAVALHTPGVKIALEFGPDIDGPNLSWVASDFSAQLLNRALRVARLSSVSRQRSRMLDLADDIWDHLLRRQFRDGPAAKLWDQANEVFGGTVAERAQPSWYYTERVVEALVTAAEVIESPPLGNPQVHELAAELLAEAEHLLDQELLRPATVATGFAAKLQTIRATLRRASEQLTRQPATAMALTNDALRELNQLAAARTSSQG